MAGQNNDSRKIQEQLTCPVCSMLYKKPKVLTCQHSFCLDCLEHSPVEFLEEKSILKCPTCSKPVQLPGGGVPALPTACTITGFLKLHQEMLAKQEQADCSKHKRPLDAFCNSCQKLVCLICAPRSHKKHDYNTIPDCIHGCTQQLEEGLQPMKQQLATMMEAFQVLSNRSEDCSMLGNIVEQQIRQQAREAREAIDQAENQLIQEARTVVSRKKEVILLQKREAKFELVQLQQSIQLAREAQNAYVDQQIVFSTHKILELLKESLSRAESLKLRPAESSHLFFEENLEMISACSNLGVLRYSYLHEKCRFMLDQSEFGRESVSELSIKHTDGSPVSISTGLISCELTSSTDSRPADCAIKETDLGKYEISCTPLVRGPHQLRVMVGGSEIPGSKFSIPVLPHSPESRGQPLHVVRELTSPSGIAVASNGQVIISESGAHRISLFNSSLERIRSVGSRGSDHGQLHYPDGVAVTRDDHILIADRENHRIQVLTAEANFLTSVGRRGTESIMFDMPVGVAVHPNGQILVSDYNTHCVRVLNSDLVFSHSFGTFGSHCGQFYHPYGMAVDAHGAVYVADCINNRIQKFAITGQFLTQFGSKGLMKGHLKKPLSIAVDVDDYVYVSETRHDSVLIFSSSGNFIRSFKAKGSGDGVLQEPQGMAVDVHHNLYVCDRSSNCVVVF